MPNKFFPSKNTKYRKFYQTYEVPFPEIQSNNKMPSVNQSHEYPSGVYESTPIANIAPQQEMFPVSQEAVPQNGFTRNNWETPSTSIAKRPYQGWGSNQIPGLYTNRWSPQKNNDINSELNQQLVQGFHETSQNFSTGTMDQLAQQNPQQQLLTHSSVIQVINEKYMIENPNVNQKMTSVLQQMKSVNLSNGIYNNNANINNFQQPPNNDDTKKFNNPANETITDLGFPMKSTPCNPNKPYENVEIDLFNKNNGGNGGGYQSKNMYPNHDSLVYEDQMNKISVDPHNNQYNSQNSNKNHSMWQKHNQQSMPQQSFVRKDFKNPMTPKKIVNATRQNHYLNREGANGQSTTKRGFSTGTETPTNRKKNSRQPPISNLFVEPRNAKLCGEKVKMPETNGENSRTLRGNSTELWETDGEPLPEKTLGFRYSKYATGRTKKTSSNHIRANHQPQNKFKPNAESIRDLKNQLKTWKKLEFRTKKSLELIIKTEKNILEKIEEYR